MIELSRNFGHQTAITAGLDHARGDAIVMIDADLQDPPELIAEMLDRWREGVDVVYAVRTEREGETRFKLATATLVLPAAVARSSTCRLTPQRGRLPAAGPRARSTRCCAMRERNRYLRGMTVWVGFTQTAVPYERDARYAGETKYTLRAHAALLARRDRVVLARAAADRDAARASPVAAFAFLADPGRDRAAGSSASSCRASRHDQIAILLLGGIQLIAIGIIGEYVGRIYDEVKRAAAVRRPRAAQPARMMGRRSASPCAGVRALARVSLAALAGVVVVGARAARAAARREMPGLIAGRRSRCTRCATLVRAERWRLLLRFNGASPSRWTATR